MQQVSRGIFFAETKLSDLIVQNDTHVLEFKGYGKRFITQHNLSPDAFVQMSIMVAYHRMYGTIGNTYESVMTKQFSHGRTEACRSVTVEAQQYCNAMSAFCDPVYCATDKERLLQRAVRKHSKLTRAASAGQGVDRHLYALYCVWKSGIGTAGDNNNNNNNNAPLPSDIPALFNDIGYDTLNATVLSTSNCGNPALLQFGFGPVTPEGYGIGYIIKDDSIHYCATSKHRQTDRFLLMLKQVSCCCCCVVAAAAVVVVDTNST